jgi:hypothetical protein
MPRPKQMVKTCEVEIARAKRTCAFTNAPIFKGSACLVVYEGPRDRSCYSREIALRMIKQARERLDEVEHQLNGSPSAEGVT